MHFYLVLFLSAHAVADDSSGSGDLIEYNQLVNVPVEAFLTNDDSAVSKYKCYFHKDKAFYEFCGDDGCQFGRGTNECSKKILIKNALMALDPMRHATEEFALAKIAGMGTARLRRVLITYLMFTSVFVTRDLKAAVATKRVSPRTLHVQVQSVLTRT